MLTRRQEFIDAPGYSTDPLDEQSSVVPGLLHKYKNRALLLVKGGCAVNCRYCFRRHFPYQDNQGNKRNWQAALDYIAAHPELDEIIFSGGDPLMAKDHELAWLIAALENIPHLKRLRIHSRLPVVIPARITDKLCDLLSETRLQVLLVTHINHAQEIDDDLHDAMRKLKRMGVMLLNQSVLLRGVNDNAQTLATLSNALFDAEFCPITCTCWIKSRVRRISLSQMKKRGRWCAICCHASQAIWFLSWRVRLAESRVKRRWIYS